MGPFYFGNAQGLKCYPTLGKMFSGTCNQMWLNLLVDDLSSSGTCNQMWLNLLVDDLSSAGTCTQMWLNLLVNDLSSAGTCTQMWLNLLVDDLQPSFLLHKVEKKNSYDEVGFKRIKKLKNRIVNKERGY